MIDRPTNVLRGQTLHQSIFFVYMEKGECSIIPHMIISFHLQKNALLEREREKNYEIKEIRKPN